MANKQYDLEERTLRFAQDVRLLGRKIEKLVMNRSDLYQVAKSSDSVGANY